MNCVVRILFIPRVSLMPELRVCRAYLSLNSNDDLVRTLHPTQSENLNPGSLSNKRDS